MYKGVKGGARLVSRTQLSDESRKIKILVADDHQIMVDGLRVLIERRSDMEVVGEACCGESALEKVRELQPDIVLLDVHMPGMDGIEATKRIKSEVPNVKVIAISAFSHKHIINQTIKAGALGFLLKESAFDDLFDAIITVSSNRAYMCPKITQVVVGHYVDQLHTQPKGGSASLSEREYEIIRLLSLGKTSKEIAKDLEMSPKTVDAHRREIMYKLKVNSIAELVKQAIRMGITAV